MSFAIISLSDWGWWLAIVSLILVATAEVASPFYGRINGSITWKKLRKVGFAFALLFFIVVLIRIIFIVRL